MTQNIAVLASLGAAILLSPEIAVLGLIAASDKKIPRTCAWVFGIGSIVGLAFALVIGFGLAHAHGNPQSEVPEQPSWSGFIIRSVIALGLLALGIYRIVNAIRHAPVEKTPEQRTEKIFTQIDTDGDGRLTLQEFMDGAKENPSIIRLLEASL